MTTARDILSRRGGRQSVGLPWRRGSGGFVPQTPGDADWSRKDDSRGFTPSARSEKDLEEQRRAAQRLLDTQGDSLSGAERERLSTIANYGFLPKSNKFLQILELIDRPASLVRAGVVDAFNYDQAHGEEITAGDYLDLLRGRTETVKAKLGEEVTGDDGRFSGSQILSLAGWDTGEGIFERSARFTASLALDIVTDPLSYVSFGTLGLGKKVAGDLAENTVRSAVTQATDSIVKNSVEEIGDRYVRKVATEIGQLADDKFDEIVAGSLREAEEAGEVITDALKTTIEEQARKDALGQAAREFRISETNDILELVTNRKFGTLAKRHEEFVHSGLVHPAVTGGITATLPFGRKRLTAGLKVPGTATDRALSKPIRQAFEKGGHLVPPSVRDIVRGIKPRISSSAPVIAARKSGYGGVFAEALAEGSKRLDDLGIRGLPLEVSASLIGLRKAAEAVGENTLEIERQVSRMLESPNPAAIARAMIEEGTDISVVERASDTATFLRGKLDEMLQTYRAVNPDVKQIENYFPRITTKEFRDWTERIVVESIDPRDAPEGLELGYQLLSELVAGSARKARMGNVDPGSFRFANERNVGKTVITPLPAEIELTLINGTEFMDAALTATPTFIPVDILNDQVKTALEDVLRKSNRLPRGGLADDFVPFDDNIATVLDTYTSALAKAVEFHVVTDEFTKLGRIRPRDTEVDLQRALFRMTQDLNQADLKNMSGMVDRLAGNTEKVFDTPLALEEVQIANNWTIDLPAELLSDPALVRTLDAARDAVTRAMEFDNLVRTGQDQIRSEMRSRGLPDWAADRIAMARSRGELRQAKDSLSQAAGRAAAKLNESVDAAIRETRGGAPEAVSEALMEVRARARQIISTARAANRKLDRLWEQRFPIRTEAVEKGVVDLAQTQANGRTTLSLLGEQIFSEVDRLWRETDWSAMSDEVQELALRVQSGDDKAVLLAALAETVDAQAEEVTRKAKVWLADHITGYGIPLPEQYRNIPIEDLPDEFIADNSVYAAFVKSVRKRQGLRPNNQQDEFVERMAQTLWDSAMGSFDHAAATQLAQLTDDTFTVAADVLDSGASVLSAMMSNDWPVIFANQNRIARLLDLVGIDGDGLVIDQAGRTARIHLTDTVEIAPARMDEVLGELRGVFGQASIGLKGEDLFSLGAELVDDLELSPGVKAALRDAGTEVPFEIRALQNVDEWFASAQNVRNITTENLRTVRSANLRSKKVNESWGRLRKGLEAGLNDGRLTPKLERIWEAERATLRSNLPPDVFEKIHYQVQRLEALGDVRVPVALLRRNQEAMQGGLWGSTSRAIQNLEAQSAFLEVASKQARYAHLRENLDLVSDFKDQMTEMLARGMRTTTTGRASLHREFELFGDEKFVSAFKDARKAAMRASRSLDAAAADAVNAADSAYLKQQAETMMLAKGWSLDQFAAEVNETYGFVPFENFGLAGTALSGNIGDENVAILLENMVKNMGALYRPEGIRMLSENSRALVSWWKGMATVARPTFVPRNLVGAAFNGTIVGVGARDYAFVGSNMAKFKRLLGEGLEVDEAIEQLAERFRPYMRGLLDSGLLDTSFASTLDKVRDGARPALLSPQTLNPLNIERFGLVRAGSYAMETSEDFVRAAAFVRHFDPARPETASMAKQLSIAVHFDYHDITELESKIRNIVPFYVWSRRNIPLQIRTLIEQPGIAARYSHLMDEIDNNFDDDRYDSWPTSQYWSGQQVGTGIVLNEGTPFWAKVMLDPQVPLNDLEDFFSVNPVSPASWSGFVTSYMGPQFTLPWDLMAQQDYNDVNAPAGLNAVLVNLDRLGIFSERIVVSEEGDAQIPREARTVVESALPFLSEVGGIAGVETDPNRVQSTGATQVEGFSGRDAALRFARSVGVQIQSPRDGTSAAYEASQYIRDVKDRLRLELDEDA